MNTPAPFEFVLSLTRMSDGAQISISVGAAVDQLPEATFHHAVKAMLEYTELNTNVPSRLIAVDNDAG